MLLSQELFEEIYGSGNYEDPHYELSKRMGVSRQEAKALMFIQLYSPSPELVVSLGRMSGINPFTSHVESLDGAQNIEPFCGWVPDKVWWDGLLCESISGLPIEESTGKKGDRVYKAPKAFWNKSK